MTRLREQLRGRPRGSTRIPQPYVSVPSLATQTDTAGVGDAVSPEQRKDPTTVWTPWSQARTSGVGGDCVPNNLLLHMGKLRQEGGKEVTQAHQTQTFHLQGPLLNLLPVHYPAIPLIQTLMKSSQAKLRAVLPGRGRGENSK